MNGHGHRTIADHAAGRRRRVGMRTLLAGTLAMLVLPVATSDAQSVEALNSKISAAQSQAQSLGAEIEAKASQVAGARAQAAAAAQREAELSAVLARGQAREAELETRVRETEARLARARAHLHRALDALAARLVAIYKGGSPDEIELLLSARGFDELANRAELVGRIEDADAALAERVRRLRDQVARDLAAAREARAQQAAFNDRVSAARDQIAGVRANAEAQAAQLEQARQQQAAALASLRSQVSAWQQQVQAAQQVSAAQAEATVSGWFGDWAIPQAIVMCESGGNFGALNPSSGAGGAYQILPSTWRLYGGAGSPQDASPQQQSQIAGQIWRDSGPGAWACAH
ncbi:MAG TPA: transglycosylase family protein [Solirubrobacterales bacterium]|nr:transglycosylase family protein [Solirubrobacterales bacterium]